MIIELKKRDHDIFDTIKIRNDYSILLLKFRNIFTKKIDLKNFNIHNNKFFENQMQTLITKKLNILRCFSKQFHDSIFYYDLYFSKFKRKILQKFDETKKHFIEKYIFRKKKNLYDNITNI